MSLHPFKKFICTVKSTCYILLQNSFLISALQIPWIFSLIFLCYRHILDMHHMAGTLSERNYCLLERFLYATQFFDSSDSTTKHTVDSVLKFMYHVSGPCNNGNSLLVILFLFFIWNQKYDSVTHDRTYQTFKEILSDLAESRVEFICPDTCSYCVAQHSILQRIAKFYNHHVAIFLLNIQKLCIIILIRDKIILQQNIIDITTFYHRYDCLKFFSDTKIITSFLARLVYLCHHFCTGLQDYLFIYRFCKKFLYSQTQRLFCIIEFIIGRYDHKDCGTVELLNFFDCLNATDSWHLYIHEADIRRICLCHLHHDSA